MHRDKLDLDGIPVFIAVARTGGISAAGKVLRLPASTISRRLTRLERQLGMRLVERQKFGVVLTDAGRGYFVSCQGALEELEAAEQALRQRNLLNVVHIP